MTDSRTNLDAVVQPTWNKRPRSASNSCERCLLHDREHGSVKLVFISLEPQFISGQFLERHLWPIRVGRRLLNWRSNVPRTRLPARTSPRSPLPSISWTVTWTVDLMGKKLLSSQSQMSSYQSTSPMTQFCKASVFDRRWMPRSPRLHSNPLPRMQVMEQLGKWIYVSKVVHSSKPRIEST